MDSDDGKLFIGGIAWDTTEDKLRDYFNQYGDVSQAVIMRDKTTGRPRGFGFVVFTDPSILDQVLQDKHTIDGRTVEAKKALSREEQHSSRSGNFNSGRGAEGGNFRTKKIFVGGLPPTLTEDGFREYFENYGHVTDVVVMYDQNTQRPRGFGFITFDTEDAVDRVLHKVFHELNGKLVEVKRALPKDANPGGGGRGGGYQGYGASGANSSSFDGRMDGNRYMQPQSTAGGFPSYSGYGGPGYGYGAASSGVGYGGYGSYGIGGYGSAATGFGALTGAYGNPNAGYMNAPPGALKSSWGSQTPSSYDSNAGSAPMGQSPSGACGYGNQGYGYGNYGGSGGPYLGGYGAASGRAGSGAGGDNSYSDTNGNSGYANAAWRSDSSQSSSGFNGGYGGAHSRQGQQQ
ncbi:heterogeneous nuclear ribonucleoprotein 1-like [Pistacia vera]|uniref:heterogeneous nuclear ribonucleoprotein 1-like n=1 Tax=Pistacia vera TaxID=55513 RepID=UPI0012630EE3|nr:heterogeneous nuclear ribonucleoprotein 1-like [Pistacia vera]